MNSTKLDKKARRKANNKCKRLGLKPLGLKEAQVRAERKFHKLDVLNDAINNGSTNDRIAAAKAKREMNVDWQDRGVASPKEYHKADQTFRDLKLDVKKRYLRAVL